MTVAENSSLLALLLRRPEEDTLAIVGSPSTTSELTIDVMEAAEHSRLLGQLVYVVVPQDGRQVVVLGQIARLETQNRWHEDLTFRGIIKRRGELPHLSARADVRTATLSVHAAFEVTADSQGEKVTEGLLATSPSTGGRVFRLTNEVLERLLADHAADIVSLGYAYGTKVHMPFWLKHFGSGAGGAGEAYHLGIFGRTGSGKSCLAAYLLLGYARHPGLGILVIDPQGQFASDRGLSIHLHKALGVVGRRVEVVHLSTDLRFAEDDYSLFTHLLDTRAIRFFHRIGVRGKDNREIAADEVRRQLRTLLHASEAKLADPPPTLLREALAALARDEAALTRIYASKEARDRLARQINGVLDDPEELALLEREAWTPVLDLFRRVDSHGNHRRPLWGVIAAAAGQGEPTTEAPARQPTPGGGLPVTLLDLSGQGTAFHDDDEVVARVLRAIVTSLRSMGERAFREGKLLNLLVGLDEAHRFARAGARDEKESEADALTAALVDGVRTTRKYGIGFLFVTQTLASLHPEIIAQLRIAAFGYGLTMGPELRKLEELVGDRADLELYRSFVDPSSHRGDRQFPFMFIGPCSPLSFTGSPVFIHAYTSSKELVDANPWLRERLASSRPGQTASR